MRSVKGEHLLLRCIKTVSKPYLKPPLGLSVERRADLLDPYNIDLTWQVIETAGNARCVEIFMNSMIMDVNRNALRKNPEKSIASKAAQMTRLWGDDSWLDAGYDQIQTLFDYSVPVKVSNEHSPRRFVRGWRRKLVSSSCRNRCP
jgi:hypothetical protein